VVILSVSSLVGTHQDHAVAVSLHDATPLTSGGSVHHLRGRSPPHRPNFSSSREALAALAAEPVDQMSKLHGALLTDELGRCERWAVSALPTASALDRHDYTPVTLHSWSVYLQGCMNGRDPGWTAMHSPL
jgi:hypothetical protein